MDHTVFVHSSIHGPLGCFHLLAVVSYAAVNMGVQHPFLVTPSFSPFQAVPFSLTVPGTLPSKLRLLCTNRRPCPG